MNKKIIWAIFLFLFFLQLVSPLEMGLSPAYLNLEEKIGEQICKNISVYADKPVDIIIRDRWTGVEKSKNLREYNLSREDFNIKIVSSEKISISADEKKSTEICFSGENAGNFYGAILFESENGYASVGSWVNLNITKNQENNFNSFTGSVIKDISKKNYLIFGIGLILETVVLFFLIKKARTKSKKISD